jgi:hypothetical protein
MENAMEYLQLLAKVCEMFSNPSISTQPEQMIQWVKYLKAKFLMAN